jgi:KaiC/GvpD/RAD55 family RecA-like ATPase
MSKEVAGRGAIPIRPATASRPSSWPTIAAVLAAMPPPGERLSTGIPTLDRCLRGGLARGRIYTIVGPPHRGKTALWTQIGLRSARHHGATVVGIYADEGTWQAALMLAEGIGFERTDLEDRYADVAARVEASTEPLDLRLPDPAAAVLEDIEEALVAEGLADETVVLIMDSIQRVRCRASNETSSAKERADQLMTAMRGVVARHPRWIILATSKANRASYARRDDTIDPIAAGLDSSAIEYDSDWMAFLEGDAETGVTARLMKNRPGDGTLPTVSLRFDRARATFTETDEETATAAREALQDDYRAARFSAAEEKVLAFVRSNPGLSGRELRERVGIARELHCAVLQALRRKGRLRAVPGPHRAEFWFSSGPDDEEIP